MTSTHRASAGAGALFFALLLAILLGACASKPTARLRVTPPAPLPAPVLSVDTDHDGVPDDSDPCPAAPEDGALPGSDDGCPGPAAPSATPPGQNPTIRLQ